MQHDKKIKRLIVIFASLTLVGIIVWLGLFLWVRSLADKYAKSEMELAEEGQKESYYASITKIMRENSAKRDILESVFTRAGSEASFVEKLESLATRANVQLRLSNFDKNETTLHAALTFKGGFQDVYHFMSLVESIPAKISISNAVVDSLQASETGEMLWEGRFEMDLLSYIAEEPNDKPK